MRSAHSLTLTTADGTPLEVVSASVTLDERRSPFVTGRFEIVLPSDATTLAALNARTGELRGLGKVIYRDPVTMAKVTAWVGSAITPAKITAKLGTQALSTVTANLSAWGNPGITNNGQEYEASVLPFRLMITRTRPDYEVGTIQVEASGLETRLIDYRQFGAGLTVTAGTHIAAAVEAVLKTVNPAWSLAPVDGYYTSLPATAVVAQATAWMGGVPAWDFIASMMQPVGAALQYTPDGRWMLIRANADWFETRTVRAITRDISETRDEWGDAVLVAYNWTPTGGTAQVMADIATSTPTPQKVVVIENRDTPYPGPGAAAMILDRVKNLSRAIDVSAVSDYTINVGHGVSVPGYADDTITARSTAVTFEWPNNLMRISARK